MSVLPNLNDINFYICTIQLSDDYDVEDSCDGHQDDNHHHGVNQGHGDNDGDNQIMLYHKPSVKFDLPVKDMMWYKTPGI